MVLALLTTQITETVITPFVQYTLLPDGTQNWGIVTNNNWIKTECKFQEQADAIAANETLINTVDEGIDDTLTDFQSQIDNEAIERSAADAALQAQIPLSPSITARFTGRNMTTGSASVFNHNLGVLPSVAVIREIGSGGVDTTSAFDTLISHNNDTQVSVQVGLTGVYTIVCNT